MSADIAERLLKLAGSLSYYEAAEGPSYYAESVPREKCRHEFNACVKEAIASGVKVDLSRYLVDSSVIKQLKPEAA